MAVNMRDISFASFNLYNLQLPDAPMYPQSRPYTAEEFAAKTRWAAEMIGRLDADVIAFQEVWSREALEAVLARGGPRSELPARLHHRRRLGRGGGGLRGAGALGDPGGRAAQGVPGGDAARQAQAVDGADPLGAAGGGRERSTRSATRRSCRARRTRGCGWRSTSSRARCCR